MSANLRKRIERIEEHRGRVDDGPWLMYGAKLDISTPEEAVEEWERENGPLNGRVPNFMEIVFVSPKDRLSIREA